MEPNKVRRCIDCIKTMRLDTRAKERRLSTSFLTAFAALAFVLNWLWEMLQMPGYVEMAGRPWPETTLQCTIAAAGDVALSLGAVSVATLVARRLRWGLGGWKFYSAIATLAALSAMAIEWWALAHGRWNYSASMPLVPLVDVGLWPFLQLTVLAPLAFRIARRWR